MDGHAANVVMPYVDPDHSTDVAACAVLAYTNCLLTRDSCDARGTMCSCWWGAYQPQQCAAYVAQSYCIHCCQLRPQCALGTAPAALCFHVQGQKRQAVANWTPPEELRQACHISSKEQYDEMYKRSIDDPEGFWGDIANQFHWEKKVHTAPQGPCSTPDISSACCMLESWGCGVCAGEERSG